LSSGFNAGRGCPYPRSFRTNIQGINVQEINIQGRQSRLRSLDDVEHLVYLNWVNGSGKFFISDDNFARNKA
jgi:hypothetical protein